MADDSSYDPFNDSILPIDTTLSGHIDAGEADWFRAPLQNGQLYQLTLQGSAGLHIMLHDLASGAVWQVTAPVPIPWCTKVRWGGRD